MEHEQAVSFAELVDWVEARVDAARAAEIAQAVAQDAELQSRVAWIREFLATAATLTWVEPPDALRAQLRANFRARRQASDTPSSTPAEQESPLDWLRRLVGVLVDDSWAQPLAAGVRGTRAGGTRAGGTIAGGTGAEHRQLAYTSPQGDVAFSILPARGRDMYSAPADDTTGARRVTVHGQIFPAYLGKEQADGGIPLPRYGVQFVQDAVEVAWVESDDLGEFIVNALAEGDYTVIVMGVEHELMLEAVPLRLERAGA